MEQPLKIGITCFPPIGGSGILATALGTELATRGHDVHFFSHAKPVRLDLSLPRIHFHEVEVGHATVFPCPDYTLPLAVKMAEIGKTKALDIFHVHYAVPHATAAFLAAEMIGAAAPKVVTSLRVTDADARSRAVRALPRARRRAGFARQSHRPRGRRRGGTFPARVRRRPLHLRERELRPQHSRDDVLRQTGPRLPHRRNSGSRGRRSLSARIRRRRGNGKVTRFVDRFTRNGEANGRGWPGTRRKAFHGGAGCAAVRRAVSPRAESLGQGRLDRRWKNFGDITFDSQRYRRFMIVVRRAAIDDDVRNPALRGH